MSEYVISRGFVTGRYDRPPDGFFPLPCTPSLKQQKVTALSYCAPYLSVPKLWSLYAPSIASNSCEREWTPIRSEYDALLYFHEFTYSYARILTYFFYVIVNNGTKLPFLINAGIREESGNDRAKQNVCIPVEASQAPRGLRLTRSRDLRSSLAGHDGHARRVAEGEAPSLFVCWVELNCMHFLNSSNECQVHGGFTPYLNY